MAERKVVVTNPTIQKETTVKRTASTLPLFEKENYMWMIIGAVIIGLGMLLMAGGKNDNPNQFDYNLVYSKTRITIAPILIIAGLLVEIYAIFKRPKALQQ